MLVNWQRLNGNGTLTVLGQAVPSFIIKFTKMKTQMLCMGLQTCKQIPRNGRDLAIDFGIYERGLLTFTFEIETWTIRHRPREVSFENPL